MGGHRQGVGRVQDLETPGRERGGDPGRTEVLDRECGVSDAGTDVILTLGPRHGADYLHRRPLPFGYRIVPRFPEMDAEKLEQLIAASTP